AAAGLLAAAGLGLAWTRLDGASSTLYRGGLLACGIAATVVLLDVTTPGASPLRRALSLAPLRWLGLVSYGLYLWHWPIYQYLQPGWHGLEGWSLVAVRVGASLAAAAVSFVVLERPVRRGALGRLGTRTLTPIAVGLAALALVIGTRGALDPAIHVPGGGRIAARYTVGPVTAPKVLVVGDSVAFALAFDGLVPHAGELGLRVIDAARIGCTLMLDVGHPVDASIRNCSPEWPALVDSTRPDVVLVLFGGFTGVVPVDVGGRSVWPCDPAYDQRWRSRLDAAVATLSARGATVVLATAPTASARIIKGDHPALFDQRQQCSNRVLADVARRNPHARLADLAAWTCPVWPACATDLGGVELRPDGIHFRGPGAQPPTRWLAPQLRAAARR
ncbi:MAG: acyltransferase family protein, partial [Acidimicrobiales bacterium]|nr:acyltransferase family protein [Acidimicrobiales bacterium]